MWHHAKCVKVSKKEYEVLTMVKESKWFCQKCEPSCEKFRLIFEEILKINSNSEKVMKEMEDLKTEID